MFCHALGTCITSVRATRKKLSITDMNWLGFLGLRNPLESPQRLLPLTRLHHPDTHARYLYLTCQCWPVALSFRPAWCWALAQEDVPQPHPPWWSTSVVLPLNPAVTHAGLHLQMPFPQPWVQNLLHLSGLFQVVVLNLKMPLSHAPTQVCPALGS